MDEEAVEKKKTLKIDAAWEFKAPKYYDFCVGETDEDKVAAEFWFDYATTYDASPHAGKSKPVAELLNLETHEEDTEEVFTCKSPNQNKENRTDTRSISFMTPLGKGQNVNMEVEEDAADKMDHMQEAEKYHPRVSSETGSNIAQDAEVSPSTPKMIQAGAAREADRRPFSVMRAFANSPGSLPAKRLHSDGWKEVQVSHPATMPPLQKSMTASTRKKEIKYVSAQSGKTPLSPDDPANKKQKLEGGRLRQIKERLVRPNEPPPAVTKPQEFKFCTEKRSRLHAGTNASSKVEAGRAMSPFVSMAEKVRSFQCRTPERFHLNPTSHREVDDHERRKMKLTRPKTPDFETSHRVVRRAKLKSTAELEVEMLAKIPKFKARPAPKKILEMPPSTQVQKSTPQVPEFQEFHFRTTERALQHKGTVEENRTMCALDQNSAVMSTDTQLFDELKQRQKSAHGVNHLSEPREPHLLTAARVRPSTVKSREDLELETLAQIPRFKARPLNKRIFESRGDIGIFRNNKREGTIPQEFHFATDERIQHRELPLDEQFGKMSLLQQSMHETSLRPTVPEPFNLETENRGLLKGIRFLKELLAREQEESEARVPKAHPLPFTTDVPAIPPKPEPKECTRPEPFQLESLIRHEEELHRSVEERKRCCELEAALKAFRAQPNLSTGPVFVPSRSRKPLTEVHEFSFHLETRAIERADFDQRVTEKHNQYKRFREEYEAARKAEEDRSIKAMRREMVPHARPMPVYTRPFVPQRSSKELTRPVSPQFNLPQSRMPSSAWRRSLRHSSTSMASVRRRMGQMR